MSLRVFGAEVEMMTEQPVVNSAGEVDPEPQETDNGPKSGDGDIDQNATFDLTEADR